MSRLGKQLSSLKQFWRFLWEQACKIISSPLSLLLPPRALPIPLLRQYELRNAFQKALTDLERTDRSDIDDDPDFGVYRGTFLA